jgi:hypothetical protein
MAGRHDQLMMVMVVMVMMVMMTMMMTGLVTGHPGNLDNGNNCHKSNTIQCILTLSPSPE